MKKKQQGSSINPAALQEVLDSASNALAQGQRQWFTPPPHAAAFALPFTGLKPLAVCDLQMGRGDLLAACPVEHRLGLDIDPGCLEARRETRRQGEEEKRRQGEGELFSPSPRLPVSPSGLSQSPSLPVSKSRWSPVVADVTKFAGLLDEAGFTCDLFTLNPPFSLLWEKERFAFLAGSRVAAVAEAYAGCGKTLDSTLATLMLGLHFCTVRGEGYLICNEATACRLLQPDWEKRRPGEEETEAKHGAKRAFDSPRLPVSPSPSLLKHVWLWLSLPGSIFAGVDPGLRVAVLYFAADHQSGPHHVAAPVTEAREIERLLIEVTDVRWRHRGGLSVDSGTYANHRSPDRWRIAAEEWKLLTSGKPAHNLWLDRDGTIRRYLTPFQKVSGRIPRDLVAALDGLHGQYPSSLVVQKATRTALLGAVHGGIWRVDPALPAAIDQAIRDYNSVRAPFYPLSEIQRIGYLDESDTIVCRRHGLGHFVPGKSYALQSRTVPIERSAERMNFSGEMDQIQVTGHDLEISIAEEGDEPAHRFVHQPDMVSGRDNRLHDLQKLVEYFTIPAVPDIATLQPARYAAAIESLTAIEQGGMASRRPGPGTAGSHPSLRFKSYQKDDLARASLHDGCILAWQAGMGKTFAAFAWPMIKGSRVTLIVAPDSLHEQIITEGKVRFGVTVKPLMSQAAFLANEELRTFWQASLYRRQVVPNGDGWSGYTPEDFDPSTAMYRQVHSFATQPEAIAWKAITPFLPHSNTPLFFITSYTALGLNGGDEWEARFDDREAELINADRLARRAALPGWQPEFAAGIGTEKNGIRCVLYPTLSTLVATLFDAVVVDEGVRMKATDAYIARGVRQLEPRFRMVLTATPIKNRLEDIFWLAHWACGGTTEPNARFPYEDSNEARERFANEHQLMERNLSKEAEARRAGRSRSYVKRTAAICNIHRLWKLLGPIVIRRRKDDSGTDIAPKLVIPIRVRPGLAQMAVYQHHLDHPPAVVKGGARELKGPAQLATQLTILRQAALCPDAPALGQFGGGPLSRSWTDFNTKAAAAYSLIVERLGLGQQVIVMSPFQHASAVLHERLRDAGVTVCLLDGNSSPAVRAALARRFKRRAFSVMVAGQKAMGEGHSFECCQNLIRMSLDWAFDINDQSGDRVHRINSPEDVRIYDLITENTIDERLASLYHEKGDSANLALDGRLFTERTEEINLAQLIHDAIESFNPHAETIDERDLEAEWPGLRTKLRHAERTFREWHPPITDNELEPGNGHDAQLSLADLNRTLAGLSADGETGRRGDGETKRGAQRASHSPSLHVSTSPGLSPDDALSQLLASLRGAAPTTNDLLRMLQPRRGRE